MKSIITRLVSSVNIGGSTAPGVVGNNPNARPGDTATSLYPQRIQDETGSYQIVLSQDPDPGGGSDGLIKLQGRLHTAADFVDVDTIDISDFDGLTDLSRIVTNVPMVYEMRIFVDETTSYSVASGTNLKVFIQE